MLTHKKALIAIIVIAIVLIVVLFVTVLLLYLSKLPNEKMLSAFNDETILKSDKNCFYVKNLTNSTHEGTHTIKVFEFTGVKKIKNISSIENPDVNLTLDISNGEFKLIAVNKRTNILYQLIDSSVSGQLKFEIPAGEYDIKIVGLYANFNLTINFRNFNCGFWRHTLYFKIGHKNANSLISAHKCLKRLLSNPCV